ncbi:MAG: hypothetical protein J6A46_03935 [Clostridia bacterium]|nr:hypothetical protein [Clostridia bacterium]
MKTTEIYGFEGYYFNRLLDFELIPISEEETKRFCKKRKTDGIPVNTAKNTVLTIFKKNAFGKQRTQIDISSACRSGSRVVLRVVLSPTPALFAYTDEEHFGTFPID